MGYRVVLCDADNTLFDFKAAEVTALKIAFSKWGAQADDETCLLYSRLNETLWKALERGEVTQHELKFERFRRLVLALNLQGDAHQLAALFEHELAQCHHLLPGAVNFMKAVHAHMPIYIVTNGISIIQRSRIALSEIKDYITDIIISEEVGSRKPEPQMLEVAVNQSGYQKKEAIMLGDSLTADIAAADAYGIDSIWLHWGIDKQITKATYHAANLEEALALILG